MDSKSPRSRNRFAASLFDRSAGAEADVTARLGDFARAVARRHNGRADRARLIVALRGYYRTWSICAPYRVPALDAGAIAVAVAAYDEACRPRRNRPAA